MIDSPLLSFILVLLYLTLYSVLVTFRMFIDVFYVLLSCFTVTLLTGMATAPQPSLHMRSTDLIKKEPLDYGGFGDVYLCYHVTLGQVVLKTIYTGPLRNE